MARMFPILCLLAAAGCLPGDRMNADPQPTQELCIEVTKDFPVAVNRDIDLLFVIDNTGSMAQEQASLETNYRRLMNVLETFEGGLPNVHIGVVSTDVGAGPFGISGCAGAGDNGTLQSVPRLPDCTAPGGAFISNVGNYDGSDSRNYTGTLADTFMCIAQLGNGGCGFSQPLEAMRRALNGSNPTNTGFLRHNAFLMVVFITDEDDCSVANTDLFDPTASALGPANGFRCFEYGTECNPDSPRLPGDKQGCRPRDDSSYMFQVQQYVDFLKGLKTDPFMVLVAGIIGGDTVVVGTDGLGQPQLEPTCSSAYGEAQPATRLRYFLDQFPQRSAVTSICNEDLTDVFAVLAPLSVSRANTCMDGNLDLDPDQPGVQYECAVSDVTNQGTKWQTESVIPECETVPPTPSGLPCWYFELDPVSCADWLTQLAFRVRRGRVSLPSGTHVVVRCAGSACEPRGL